MRLVPEQAVAGTTFFSGMSSCSGPWWLSQPGVGLTGRGRPPPLSLTREEPHTSSTPPHPASGLLLRTFGAHAPALQPVAPRPGGGGSHGDMRWTERPERKHRRCATWWKAIPMSPP